MHRTIRQLTVSAYLSLLLSASATAQIWTDAGHDHSWNQPSNWNNLVIPGSSTADVIFPELLPSGLVNIASSVQSRSITFTNTAHPYTLTSSANKVLSALTNITVSSGVTATDTINLASVATGSLVFPSSGSLTI